MMPLHFSNTLPKKSLNRNSKQRILICSFVLILFFSFCVSSVNAQYYADVIIDVDSSGFTTIEGTTNYPDLLTQNSEKYTSKNQNYWLLNITYNSTFDFIYEVLFPDSTEINYVKASGHIRIHHENGRLKLKGYGVNETFSIVAQYNVNKIDTSENVGTIPGYVFIGSGILLLCISMLIFIFRSKKEKDTASSLKASYNLDGLSERQQEIMDLLIKEKRSLTQTEIQKKLGIPKSAVSRNIAALELKNLIEKETIGMSNLIRLKKQE